MYFYVVVVLNILLFIYVLVSCILMIIDFKLNLLDIYLVKNLFIGDC